MQRPWPTCLFAGSLAALAGLTGCADDPPPPPRAPIVEETVTYLPGVTPPATESTASEPAPAASAAPRAERPSEPAPPDQNVAPFVPSSASVEGIVVLQFQSGMTRPTKVSGRDPRAAKPTGDDVVFVQGIVETDGRFTHCRIIRGARSLNDEVLRAVQTWRVTPIVFHGKPTAVLYTWPIRVQRP